MVAAVTVRQNGKAEFAYVGEKAWHGLGNQLEAGASFDTWVEAAGMDWSIERAEAMFQTPTMFDAEGNKIKASGYSSIEDKHVLFRSDNHLPLGVVSDNYKIVQPREVLEFMRDATGYELETAGTLFDGKRFWGLARVQSDEFIMDRDDKVGGYLLLSTSADGTLATEARMTTIRVVCNNTLSLARSNGKAAFKAKHKTEFDANKAREALGINKTEVEETFATAMESFRRMARNRVTQNDQVKMTLELFGYDTENMSDAEYAKAVRKPLVSAVGTLAVTGRDLIGGNMAGVNGTTWGWLNAVTQYVDHMARTKSDSHRLNNAWFGKGDELKQRAHEIALVQAGTGQVVTYAPDDGDDSLLSSVLAATAAGN